MFSVISLPVPSQQMTMFLMDAASPRVAGGRLATGGGDGYWDLRVARGRLAKEFARGCQHLTSNYKAFEADIDKGLASGSKTHSGRHSWDAGLESLSCSAKFSPRFSRRRSQ